MLRGFDFDSFGMDDFRESNSYDRSRETGAGRGGSSLSGASVRLQPQKLREKETISDRPDSQQHISRATAPDLRNLPLRSDRERTQYSDRDRTFSLRPSEIHTLTDVGSFRVVAVEDLVNLGYAGDGPGMDSDLRSLVRQSLLQRRGTSALKKESQYVLTSAELTLNTYTHAITSDERKFVDELGEILHTIAPKKGNGLEGAFSKPFVIN